MAGQLGAAGMLADVFADIGGRANAVTIKPGLLLRSEAGDWSFSSGGVTIKAIFGTSLLPISGAPCVAIVLTPPKGLSTAWVLDTTQASPNQGGIGKILVVNGDGVTASVEVEAKTITATRVTQYTPAVSDQCLVEWRGSSAYVIAKIGAAPPPPSLPPTVAPPKPVITTGTFKAAAQDSGTWTNGYNWNSYFGQNVYSGSGYVPLSSGSWFYSGATRGLADKGTITSVRFYLPARRQAGAYNSTATVHFYRHGSNTRGSTEPSRTVGPYDVNVAAGWGGGYITLPTSFGDALKAGGGISIAGDPYVGFTGISGAGNSGHLIITWKKS